MRVGAATSVSPALQGTTATNSVDAKFAAAFGPSPAVHKPGLYADQLVLAHIFYYMSTRLFVE